MFKMVTKVTASFLVIVSISCVSGIDNSVVALLNAIVDHEADPTNVFIKSCWPLYVETDILRLATMQIVFIEDFMYELPIDLSPNNVLFVTSLDCEGSDEFVAGVR